MSLYEKWHIYRANLDPVVGSEQGRTRPVLVISEDDLNAILNCVNIIPITTRKPKRLVYPNEVLLPESIGGLPSESIALCHQIRTIDKHRLAQEYGEVKDEEIRLAIFQAIRFQLGI